MKRTHIILTSVASTVVLCAMAFAQAGTAPFVNIDPNRHGNLASAQESIVQAYSRINEAQRDNHDQLGGHAQKAKELLSQANDELRLAADVSNEHQDQQPPQQQPHW